MTIEKIIASAVAVIVAPSILINVPKTREQARTLRKAVNSAAPATLKAPVKSESGWVFPGITHKDGLGTLSLTR